MAIGKRWTIPFMSKAGVSCHIDIYQDEWTGSVTTLTGGDTPIIYDEKDDKDLLSPIRYKTGYINIVEQNYGDLIDLYPDSDTSRYVEFYYGSRLDFTGYIQASSYDNDFCAGPIVVSFPIISPLGLLANKRFQAITSPGYRRIGVLLEEVITGLGADGNAYNYAYESVVFPKLTSGSYGRDVPTLDAYLRSAVISPRDTDFDIIYGTVSDLYAPITYLDFMRALCNAFGWMAYDTPNQLVFRRVDCDGDYYICDTDSLANPNSYQTILVADGASVYDLTSYFTFRDNKATMSHIRPKRRVTVNYDYTDIDSCSFDDITTVMGTISPESSVFTPINNEYESLTNGASLVYCSDTRMALFNLTSLTTQQCKLRFYNHPYGGGYMNLNIHLMWGRYPEEMGNEDVFPDEPASFIEIEVLIKHRGLYYNFRDNVWQSTLPFYYSEADKGGNINLTIKPSSSSPYMTFVYDDIIEVELRCAVPQIPLPTGCRYVGVDSFEFVRANKPFIKNETFKKVFEGSNASTEEAEVDQMFVTRSRYDCIEAILQKVTQYGNPESLTFLAALTNYAYMLNEQHRIQAKFALATFPQYPYIVKWQYWQTGWNWRMVAMSCNPVDDEYTLTLHHSPQF